MQSSFHPFTREHLVALAIGTCVAVGFILVGKRGIHECKHTTRFLAFLNLSIYPLSLMAWQSINAPKSIDNFLPFHLCDIAAITAGIALLTKRELFCKLTYFWGLAATVQGLVTPAITVGFPSWPFVMFFVHHFAVVTAALYLPIVAGWHPKQALWKEILEVSAWTLAYLGFAMAVNQLLGSNFAFASRPPDNPSLIDQLGDWPWYLFAMQGIALTLFSILTLPFLWVGRRL